MRSVPPDILETLTTDLKAPLENVSSALAMTMNSPVVGRVMEGSNVSVKRAGPDLTATLEVGKLFQLTLLHLWDIGLSTV